MKTVKHGPYVLGFEDGKWIGFLSGPEGDGLSVTDIFGHCEAINLATLFGKEDLMERVEEGKDDSYSKRNQVKATCKICNEYEAWCCDEETARQALIEHIKEKHSDMYDPYSYSYEKGSERA